MFPVVARERLREPTSRMKAKLEMIAENQPNQPVLVRERDGAVSAETLGDLAKRDVDELAYTLVLLLPGCGGLESGMLVEKNGEPAGDVGDGQGTSDNPRRRYLSRGSE